MHLLFAILNKQWTRIVETSKTSLIDLLTYLWRLHEMSFDMLLGPPNLWTSCLIAGWLNSSLPWPPKSARDDPHSHQHSEIVEYDWVHYLLFFLYDFPFLLIKYVLFMPDPVRACLRKFRWLKRASTAACCCCDETNCLRQDSEQFIKTA